MSWQYYTTDSHTLRDKMSAWAPNANKELTLGYPCKVKLYHSHHITSKTIRRFHDRIEWVETQERVYKKQTLHDNHIRPKQPKIVNKESTLQAIGRNDHDNNTQRKQCGEQWDVKRKVRCRPNVHASTTTPVRVTTGVKTERRQSTSSKNGVEGGM